MCYTCLKLTGEISESCRSEDVVSSCLDERATFVKHSGFIVQQTLLEHDADIVGVKVFLKERGALGSQRRQQILLAGVQHLQDNVTGQLTVIAVDKPTHSTVSHHNQTVLIKVLELLNQDSNRRFYLES